MESVLGEDLERFVTIDSIDYSLWFPLNFPYDNLFVTKDTLNNLRLVLQTFIIQRPTT